MAKRRAHLFGIGETKRRRRSRSGSKGWTGVDTVMTVGALGALAFVGYFVLKSGKGVEETLQTGGDWLKNFTDAINSTGNWIGSGSKWLQDWSYGVQKGFGEAVGGTGETIMNAGCRAQQGLAWLTGGIFGKGPTCTGDPVIDKKIAIMMAAGGSPKPYPKITNNVYNTMMRMGFDPDFM